MTHSTAADLARASHPGPTVTVTALAGLLAVGAGADVVTGLLVTAAVLAGQVTIGWSNDLLDAGRDRAAGRSDKPMATGELDPVLVGRALVVVLVLAAGLSFAAGWHPALVHLGLVVGSGWAYNLGVKGTLWSWVPYAVAFGSLPSVVSFAVGQGWAPVWMTVAGATLGVGAHLLNVLPDLVADELTGVRGLPQRLGQARTRLLGPLVLLLGSVVVALAPGWPVPVWAWLGLGVCGVLAVVAWSSRGSLPFVAAMLLALTNVAALLLRG